MTVKPTSQTLGVKFERVDDAAAFPVGLTVEGANASMWVYGVAGAALALGQVVVLDAAWSATLVTTAASPFGERLAVAPAAFANGQYGWFQYGGVCAAIQVAASAAANVRLNTTATGGQLDDDGTAGAKTASGIVLTTARGGTAGTAPGVLFGSTVGATL
jgi:hypothetical protein